MRWVGGIAMGMVCVALVPARLAAQVPPGCVSTSDPEIVTSPPNGASDVAINTPIQIRVQDDDQPLFALYRGLSFETQTPVAARWQRFGNTEQFAVVPEALLEPDTDYTIRIRTRDRKSVV